MLTEWPMDELVGRRRYIYEVNASFCSRRALEPVSLPCLSLSLSLQLFENQSVVEYWENFASHAFENTTKAVYSHCVLLKPSGAPLPATFCFSIRRDIFDLPSIVIGELSLSFLVSPLVLTSFFLARPMVAFAIAVRFALTRVFPSFSSSYVVCRYLCTLSEHPFVAPDLALLLLFQRPSVWIHSPSGRFPSLSLSGWHPWILLFPCFFSLFLNARILLYRPTCGRMDSEVPIVGSRHNASCNDAVERSRHQHGDCSY